MKEVDFLQRGRMGAGSSTARMNILVDLVGYFV
jgi:hypothetical protein